MAQQKSEQRLEREKALFAAIDSGMSVGAAAKSIGLDARKAYGYNKARNAETPQIDAPGPPKDVPSEPIKVGKTGKGGKRPITEDTATKLIEGIFILLAIAQSKPLWLLTSPEKSALGGPLADSLAMVPGPIANAVNTYAAPGVLATTIIGIVASKSRAIAAKRAGKPFAQYTPPQPTSARGDYVPQGAAPQPPPAQAQRTEPDITDFRSAAAAAKGGLAAFDEANELEEELRT